MKVFPRDIEGPLRKAARSFPAVVLTGPRRAGKTFCLRHTFPAASYHLLEDPDVLARLRADPRAFLDEVRTPAILDEVQNAPEILRYIRARIDAHAGPRGRWLLTGSQDFALMQGVTESMSGRAAILHLWPLSGREAGALGILLGGYPEVRLRPRSAGLWFPSYVQTYLERDVRAVTAVRDLALFRRFLGLLATRSGQMLNRTDLAGPLGVSVPTVSQWISVLETTGVVMLVPPFFENLGKRLVKSPKLYFTDTGLLCHLLGLRTPADLERSPLVGAVFETLVASELAKQQVHRGGAREIYHFRDEDGLEVDFVVPDGHGGLDFLEAKWTRTPRPEMAKSLAAVISRVGNRPVTGRLIHRGGGSTLRLQALSDGVQAQTLESLVGLDEATTAPRKRPQRQGR